MRNVSVWPQRPHVYIHASTLAYKPTHVSAFLHLTTMMNKLLLLAALVLPCIAKTPSYFTITSVAVDVPVKDNVGRNVITFGIEDPATKTSTSCTATWYPQDVNTTRGYAPSDWVCIDSCHGNQDSDVNTDQLCRSDV